MSPEEFAARRSERLQRADAELRPLVLAALEAWDGEDSFRPVDLIEAVEVIWLEHFAAEAPNADEERFLAGFRDVLTDSLAKTSAPEGDSPVDSEVERVLTFLGTLAVNDGTFRGVRARGVRFKRWTTMEDTSVRESHRLAAGQIRAIDEPFRVAGVELQYPGEPIGPPEGWIQCRCLLQPAAARGDSAMSDTTFTIEEGLTAAAGNADTGVGVFLIPEAGDPVVEASSEPAHLTTVWLGDIGDLSEDEIAAIEDEVKAYSDTLGGPVVAPVTERGELGDQGADVVFLEPTEALVALRDGLLEASPTISEVMGRVEQFPEWTPHVTLGYPETPAAGEYDGDKISFDKVGLWVGSEHKDFDMGGDMRVKDEEGLSEARERLSVLAAAATEAPEAEIVEEEAPEGGEMPVDELEEGEELITEIPVHGVATLEGRPTGDGRGFRPGAIDLGVMPQPLGYEYVSTHGGDTSHVAIVGRIDEYWREEVGDVSELRWKGVVLTTKEYAAQAIESMVDGSYTGLSVIVDDVAVDVEEEREELRQRILAEREGKKAIEDEEVPEIVADDEYDIEEILDMMVGDGTQGTTWFSHARVRRFDMVPTGAYQEAYIALGHEFPDELTPEQIEAAALALDDCGCTSSANTAQALVAAATDTAPGVKADGQPPKCEYGDEPATKYVLHSEGMAYAPACDEHLEQAKSDAAASVPDGEPDESNIDKVGDYGVGHDAFRDYSDEERKQLAEEGKAMEDGSYPIADEEDLKNAIQAIGRASDPEAARAHIEKRARELELEDLISEDWSLVASAFAPGTRDGPGWITNPIPTSRIRRYWVRGKGAAKIRWGVPGDFNRCRRQLAKYIANPEWLAGTCANMHHEAIGVWPGQEHSSSALTASAEPRSLFSLVASADPIDADFFKRRELEDPNVGAVVDGDQIYGYIAQWNVCHVGSPEGANRCTMAPRSPSGYSQYLTGTVMTTEGPVRVGQITMNTGHAGATDSPRSAVAHYDNTGAVVADVACGEDQHGIWYAGRIRPHVSDEDRFALAASGRLSGDWRMIGSSYELVAALVVNVPGFPIPAASLAASADLGPVSLVAAGVVPAETEGLEVVSDPTPAGELSAERIADIAIAAAEQVLHVQKRQEIINRAAPARSALAAHQLLRARAKLATTSKEN